MAGQTRGMAVLQKYTDNIIMDIKNKGTGLPPSE
jgi:hypothetical protein